MASASSATVTVATGVIETGGDYDSISQPKTASVSITIPQTWSNRLGTAQLFPAQTKVMRTDGCAGDTQNDTTVYATGKTEHAPNQPRL